MATITTKQYISQDYFDELCIENHELFESDDVNDAVQETIEQLQGTSLQHISCTFPTSENRTSLRQFHQALEERDCHALLGYLDDSSSAPSSPASASTEEGTTTTLFRHLFLVQDGFSKLCECYAMSYEGEVVTAGGVGPSGPLSTTCSIATTTPRQQVQLLTCLDRFYCSTTSISATSVSAATSSTERGNRQFRLAFQAAAPLLIPQWLASYNDHRYEQQEQRESGSTSNDNNGQRTERRLLYWTICYKSIYRCEVNKKLWMKQEAFPPLLMEALLMQEQQQQESSSSLSSSSSPPLLTTIVCCRVLTCLCTFDDFANADLVQSYHQTVQTLATPRTIETLHGLIRVKDNDDTLSSAKQDSLLTIPVLQALRALAVQDQVVVRLMEVGVVATAVALFVTTTSITTGATISSSSMSPSDPKDNVALLTALLGLFRNLSANDKAKQQLCTRELMTALLAAGSVVAKSREAIEHALAWLAALALRSPQNASFLMELAVHETIVAWMDAHVDAVLVQRPGALALRNLASRATGDEKARLVNDCHEALLRAAAHHINCHDQVYAALRDMGAPGVTAESIVHVETVAAADGSGAVTAVRVRKAEQFGEGHNANFRPVFDD